MAVHHGVRPTGPAGMSVRSATEQDLSELVRMDHRLFPDMPYPYFALRQLFELYRDRLLVLDHDGELAGYALFATTADGARSWVLALGVVPGVRGLGYGRRLMAQGLRRLADDGVREVMITVAPGNAAACGLYESLGFVQVDHRVDYFGPGADRLIMRMSLPGWHIE
ncbi:GNAT family N-acetyltransferase [Kitasatospora sp. CM 4170]|uniref:GNAT family N-acetyltransferase n=1 Tax=Kitasatospora TaxID=2063 RepID=UPI0028AF8F88|nr:GNAT family N-acetyltransferase [Kitasatospora sp. CM 4170]WNM50290.1 GNAT family N-acetyltransferase [Kitasatospora sp. CM 4170]